MLRELRVENLLLIDRAELRLAPGLNVLTGETGAGKTVLAHALDLLLGGKPRPGIVRPGAAEAYVEGVFDLPDELRAALGDRLPEDADELVIARRVGADGRTRALLNGRSSNVADLREAAEAQLAFYGQHEHRRLTLASAQLELLDAFCGPEQARRRAACAEAHGDVRAAQQALEDLSGLAGARERELDLLAYELREIDEVAPDEAEERELLAARERLRHVEALRAAAHGRRAGPGAGRRRRRARAARRGRRGARGRRGGRRRARRARRALARRCSTRRATSPGSCAATPRGWTREPGALEAAEERLEAVDRLKRKHGGTVAAVLEHAERCRARHDELANAEVALEQATARLAEAGAARERLALELPGGPRRGGAAAGAGGRRGALADLAMEGASFDVVVSRPRPRPVRRRRGRVPARAQQRRPGGPRPRDGLRR